MTDQKKSDTAGVILAGGRSRRFGSNKALATMTGGRPLIQQVANIISTVFTETLIVTNTPEEYAFLGWPTAADRFAAAGPLAGIHAGLQAVKSSRVFVVGCDMPHIYAGLIKHLCGISGRWDAAIPRHSRGVEPLHAVYHKSSLPIIEQSLLNDERKIGQVLKKLKVRWVEEAEILTIVPDLAVFHNVNRPQDLYCESP